MRRREMPEVVGMPFLDLVCCAFGGLILLYLLAQREDGTPSPVIDGVKVIIAETRGSEPHLLALGLEIDGTSYVCIPPDDCAGSNAVAWDSRAGATVASVKGDVIAGDVLIGVAQFDNPLEFGSDLCVRVSAPGMGHDHILELPSANSFRALSTFGTKATAC